MLTLNALGKHGAELVKFLRDSVKENENEIKILIDGPIQVEEIRKFLEPLNFSDFVLEDDEGSLYLMTSKKSEFEEAAPPPTRPGAAIVTQAPVQKIPVKIPEHKEFNLVNKHSTGVLISCPTGKYKNIFMKKILKSLVTAKIKPEILGLMNGAVKLAAYNSITCDYLKELESAGVKILISESCADLMGVTEAVGAGALADMSEIFEEIFSCEKVVNL